MTSNLTRVRMNTIPETNTVLTNSKSVLIPSGKIPSEQKQVERPALSSVSVVSTSASNISARLSKLTTAPRRPPSKEILAAFAGGKPLSPKPVIIPTLRKRSPSPSLLKRSISPVSGKRSPPPKTTPPLISRERSPSPIPRRRSPSPIPRVEQRNPNRARNNRITGWTKFQKTGNENYRDQAK